MNYTGLDSLFGLLSFIVGTNVFGITFYCPVVSGMHVSCFK